MAEDDIRFDVVVVGAGNAALCAALAARDAGAQVVVLEKASASEQGGNCPYTGGGFRFIHDGIEDIRWLVPELPHEDASRLKMAPYTADDFRRHLLTVTRGEVDKDLMEVLIARSRPTVEWMHSKGVRWELPAGHGARSGAPSTVPSAVGLAAWHSGKGLVEMLTAAARRGGVDILYETKMLRLVQDPDGGVVGVLVQDADGVHEVRSDGVVLACGGFEANPDMRAKYLSRPWKRAKVRGSRHNTGDGHRAAMEAGALSAGQWTGCHCTPIDVDAPDTGDLAVTDRTPRRSYPLGIMVNRGGRRFVDEGDGYAEQSFVKVGKAILEQEGGIAFQIFDGRAVPFLEARYGSARSVQADTVPDLADRLGVDGDSLADTVEVFNAQAHEAEYAPGELDGRSTATLDPPKSNWAIRIETPPFMSFTVTGGITYTYGGLAIDRQARVLDMQSKPIAGLFAAGEIVGGIFYHNSLRAAGLMHGAVFGRLAGRNAARRA